MEIEWNSREGKIPRREAAETWWREPTVVYRHSKMCVYNYHVDAIKSTRYIESACSVFWMDAEDQRHKNIYLTAIM